MKNALTVVLISLVSACQDNNQSNDTADTGKSSISPTTASADGIEKPAIDTIGCYMKIAGRDTAILILRQKGNDLSGQMLYDNYEKDGSSGTVKGTKDGAILKLYYDFNSEGTRSVMEVYFKEVTGGLLRGVGDMDVKADTAYFRSGINYSDKEAFSKVDCSLVKAKFE